MASEQQQAWIARVLGISAASGGTADRRAEFTDRLKIVADDARTWGIDKDLAGGMREAAMAVQSGDASAAGLIDALERRIADAARSKRSGEALQTANAMAVNAKTGVVAFAKMRMQMQMARNAYGIAVENLQQACAKLLETPDFVTDPRSADPATLSAISQIASSVPDIEPLAGAIDDALDRMGGTADPQARASAKASAVKAIGDYRIAIEAEPLLTRMQSTPAGAFPIRDALFGALATLETALTAPV